MFVTYKVLFFEDYNDDGDNQLAGDPDLGGMEESGYLSDGDRDEPPWKRMKTHHEEDIMPHQSHDSLPPRVPQQEHEPVQQEHEDTHQVEEPTFNVLCHELFKFPEYSLVKLIKCSPI